MKMKSNWYDMNQALTREQYGLNREMTSKLESRIKEIGKVCDVGDRQGLIKYIAGIELEFQKNEDFLRKYPQVNRQYETMITQRCLSELRSRIRSMVKRKLEERYGKC